jgi:translation initiation factor 2D
MFKKNITVAGTRQLGGKDVKKFRGDIAKHYPDLDEESLNLLFPPKAQITQSKLSNRTLVYGIEGGNPLFFDPTGHGDRYLPTVYATAIVPTLVPTLYTHSQVSSKLLNGADLFLQGIIMPSDPPEGECPLNDAQGLDEFLVGSVRSVTVAGNPVPFALGTMAVSSREALRDGMKGRGLALIHSYGDLLWQMGDKVPPNEGFSPSQIHPLMSSVVDDAAALLKGVNIGEEGGGQSPLPEDVQDDDTAETDNVQNLLEPSGTGAVAEISQPPQEDPVDHKDMDALLEAAAIGGLKSLKNADLPIMTSDFYSKYMLPHRPDGVVFDFKKSKFKKLSKLLDKLEKDKMLTQKQIRKQEHITAVNRTHQAIAAFEQARSSVKQKIGKDASQGSGGVMISKLFRPPASLRPVFGPGVAEDKDRLYTEQEVMEALLAYCSPDANAGPPPSVPLDNILASCLYGKKEGPKEGDAVPWPALSARFLSKLQQWYSVVRHLPGGEAPLQSMRKGPLRAITIIAERRGGRSVTAVSRVEGFCYDPAELSGSFQRRFSTACSVSKLPGKMELDCELLLQGNVAKQVASFFIDHEGIDPCYVEVTDKLKK